MKRTACLLLTVILLFCGCSAQQRIDGMELSERLKKYAPQFGFEIKELLTDGEGAYYSFYSLKTQDDALMKLTVDEEERIDRILLLVRADTMSAGEAAEIFPRFAEAVIYCFTNFPSKTMDSISETLCLYDETMYFQNFTASIQFSRFVCSVTSANAFTAVECECL